MPLRVGRRGCCLEIPPRCRDSFPTVPPRDVANGGLRAALLSSSPTGAYFAHKLGLAEGSRLRSLSTASDIKCLLEGRETRDDIPKISATALRRNICKLAPAASFLKDTVSDVVAFELLKDKGLPNLQEKLRTGSHEAQHVPAPKPIAPLPPLPLSLPVNSGQGPTSVTPLVPGVSRGTSSDFQLDLRPIPGGARGGRGGGGGISARLPPCRGRESTSDGSSGCGWRSDATPC